MGSMTDQLRVVSHGGGVQTTAMLVLAAQGRIDYHTFLFANVGDDSEHPGTLRYLREIAMPYADAHGITIHELHKTRSDGTHETVLGRIMKPGSKSDVIPVRLNSGVPGSRSCTTDFKIRVIGKWLKEHGATKDNPATVAVGISADEIHRANTAKREPYEQLVYPLIRKGDDSLPRPLNRSDCERIIRDAELPSPGKSACWFCPNHRMGEWANMARQEPDLFERSAQIEDYIQTRRTDPEPVWLSNALIPLRRAFGGAADQLTFEGMDEDQHCDNGWCMT